VRVSVRAGWEPNTISRIARRSQNSWQAENVSAWVNEALRLKARSVEADGPQFLTRHGEEVAVVVSIAEYSHLKNAGKDFKSFLQSAPDIDLEISRLVLPRHPSTNAGEAGRPGS
jgi:prevent-host-death family protein